MLNPSASLFLKKAGESSKYYIPHHMLLSHNLETNIGDLKQCHLSYEDFPFHVAFPLPVSDFCLPMVEDSHIKLALDKEKWHRDVKALKTLHKGVPENEKTQEIIYSAQETSNVPSYIYKFTKLLKEDPDEYFDSHFNWYMSGTGNLSVAHSNDTERVFAVVGNALYALLNDDCKIKEVDSKETTKYVCENMKPIYETILYQTLQKQIIGLRQRNTLHLIEYTNDETPQLESVTMQNSSLPLTSIAFDKINSDVLYADISGDIYLYNLQEMSSFVIEKGVSDTALNNWSSLQVLDERSLININRKNVCVLDRRKQHPSLTITPSLGNDCDYIISSQSSINPNYIYLGTLHNFCQCDLRQIKNDKSPLVRWTHGLKSPPIFLRNFNLNNTEVIALGSQFSDELCLINNPNSTQKDVLGLKMFDDTKYEVSFQTKPNVIYLPKHLPNVMNSFNTARKKGFCLDPTIDLRKRLSFSRTGLTYIKSDKGIQLLSLNCAGDVFSQQITVEKQETFGQSKCEEMEKWSKKLKAEKFPFVVSSQTNLKHFQYSMKRQRIPTISGRKSKGFVSTNRRWKQSLQDLSNYSDMWANELLSIWDVKEVKQGIDSLLPPPVDTKFKVEAWANQFAMDLEND